MNPLPSQLPVFRSSWPALVTVILTLAIGDAFTQSSINFPRTSHRPEHRVFSSDRDEPTFFNDPYPRFQPKEYLATCIPGLAPYLEEELIALGASSTTQLSNAAVSFTDKLTSSSSSSTTDHPISLRALLWLRTAHRILEKIDVFCDLESRDDVYDAVQRSRMPVQSLLGDGQGGLLSLNVKVIANGRLPKDISHSHYTALMIKNALVDQVRDMKNGERPDVDLEDPDVPLVAILHSRGNTADMTLYRSLATPGSLHKRGYRSGGAIHKAAMKESLAAGLLIASGWMNACRQLRVSSKDNDQLDNTRGGLTLVDPMCGSGSLLIEGAMMAVDFAPGLMRVVCGVPGHQIPPVLRWKENKDTLLPVWKEMLLDASQKAKAGLQWIKETDRIKIIGNDNHGGAMELLESSLAKASGLGRIVDLHQNDCRDWTILCNANTRNNNNNDDDDDEQRQVWVVVNPPWGVRLSDDDHESWESLRTFLRSNCPPGRTQAWVLSGNKAATKHLGLRRSQSIAVKTGEQDLRWIQYVILDKTDSAPIPTVPERQEQLKTKTRTKTTQTRVRPDKPIPTRKIAITTPITKGLSADNRSTSLRISAIRTKASSSRDDDDSWS